MIGEENIYHAAYIEEIRRRARALTRKQLRHLLSVHHGQTLPKDANLRNYVAKFHAHQQAINAGAPPSAFWRRAVGLA